MSSNKRGHLYYKPYLYVTLRVSPSDQLIIYPPVRGHLYYKPYLYVTLRVSCSK